MPTGIRSGQLPTLCRCCVIILLLLLSASSWGFESEAHRELSARAVEIFNELNPSSAERDAVLTARFIVGSEREDGLSIQRAINWHFYDPGKRLGHTWWGAHKSNRTRYEDLADELARPELSDLESYEVAGRLVHHLQDMSSPPHTVPVYHTTQDAFDKHGTSKIAGVRLPPERVRTVLHEQRSLKRDDLYRLLDEAAARTIARIGQKVEYDGALIAENWAGFWRSHELTGAECGKEPQEGFGCYGKSTFGRVTGRFTPDIYNRFYQEQVASALEDSLRLLALLEKMRGSAVAELR